MYNNFITDERSLRMEHEKAEKQLTGKEKMNIIFATLAGLGVGGVIGVIAYYQQWLG